MSGSATIPADAMPTGNAPPFNPRAVLAMVLLGAVAFLATLYFIASGQTGGNNNNGGEHAASNGLLGFTALAKVLESTGHEVALSRSPAAYDTENLLILTPPHNIEQEDITAILDQRRYIGPTLIILPKWMGIAIPSNTKVKKEDGWVNLGPAITPSWIDAETPDFLSSDGYPPFAFTHHIDRLVPQQSDWRGLGLQGNLPDRTTTTHLHSDAYVPLVADSKDQTLAGYFADNGNYPALDDIAGRTLSDDADLDDSLWNVTIVTEPDLMNNYGFSDRTRAMLAHKLVDTVMEGEDLGVTFDLTLNGMGRRDNLLTLAFRPPFLAATICLILALFVVGWRAFLRFGPPVAEERAMAFGKAQLIGNSARLIERSKRLHLLAEPYIALVGGRIARSLGLKKADPDAIGNALSRRFPDGPNYSRRAALMRAARGPKELLRAARALNEIERMLNP